MIWAKCPRASADRFSRLQAAIEVARVDPPHVVSGDIVQKLSSVVAIVPDDQHL
ncbi:MAG: DUF2332 family protein, partial [Geodermatophilaceae bacterium]|nr:DUF2332 family protein [Geodermatophilaceae bacterium]